MTDFLGILRNDLKDTERRKVIRFRIEIDTKSFIAKLSDEKLEKVVKKTSKILAEQSVTFLSIQSLVRFLFFSSQVVYLGKIFIQKL